MVDQPADSQREDHSGSACVLRQPCAIPNCSSTRVATSCTHHCCRKHCIALGGCQLRKHRMTPTEQKRHVPIDPILLAPTSTLPALSPPLTTTVEALPTTFPVSPDLVPAKRTSEGKGRTVGVDMLASARHPSQMPAVFTQGYAQQEALRQQKEVIEIERRAVERAAANTIDAYGWHMVRC